MGQKGLNCNVEIMTVMIAPITRNIVETSKASEELSNALFNISIVSKRSATIRTDKFRTSSLRLLKLNESSAVVNNRISRIGVVQRGTFILLAK